MQSINELKKENATMRSINTKLKKQNQELARFNSELTSAIHKLTKYNYFDKWQFASKNSILRYR